MRFAVILAGGSGTRLWPMSRAALPKQMLPFINGRSLLEHAWDRLEGLVENPRRVVCAGDAHRELIQKSLPGLAAENFLGEPVGRDTLAALGFTAAVISRRDPEATIGVFTADHLIEPAGKFRDIVSAGYDLAEREKNALVTFGITPRYAATSYGYLSLGDPVRPGEPARTVREFREKPDRETAEQWVSQGPERFLWNSGMFVWKASTFLDCVRRYEPEAFASLSKIIEAWDTPRFSEVISEVYPTIRKISVDFAVMEKASRDQKVSVAAVPMDLSWLDIGSWPAFSETCPKDASGNSISAERHLLLDTRGSLVASSERGHLIASIGCDDLIVIHTPDATLVCRKDRAEDIKKLQALVAERYGGEYT